MFASGVSLNQNSQIGMTGIVPIVTIMTIWQNLKYVIVMIVQYAAALAERVELLRYWEIQFYNLWTTQFEGRNNCGHFVPPNKTRAVIINNDMTFDKLKKELPEVNSHRYDLDTVRKNVKADKEAGGSKLFKGSNIHDVAKCDNCHKLRPIYSMYALKSSKNNLSAIQ